MKLISLYTPRQTPLLWGCLFFAIGILVANLLGNLPWPVFAGGCLFFGSLTFLSIYKKRHSSLSAGLVYALFLCLGAMVHHLQHHSYDTSWPSEKNLWRGIIVDFAQQNKVGHCTVWTHSYKDGNLWIPCRKTVNITIFLKDRQPPPKAGDGIMAWGQMRPFVHTNNPYEFDFAAWNIRQGKSGETFVAHNWDKLSSLHLTTVRKDLPLLLRLKIKGIQLRSQIAKKYARLSLSPSELPILKALTLGDKSHLTKDTRNLYSHTGAAHILALSGTHLSILLFFLTALLSPLKRYRYGKLLSIFLPLVFIWTFAWITGLSLSLSRASLMFTLLCLFRLQHLANASLSNLAASAFIILIVNTDALFDIGFQLSFLSVLAIITLYPIYKPYRPPGKIPSLLADLLFFSIAAQIGSAPIVAYQFHTFPTYFLLTNLIVIPCTYILLCCSLLYLIFNPINWLGNLFGISIGFIAHFMNEQLTWISLLPYSPIHLYPTLIQICLVYLVFIILFLFKFRKRINLAIAITITLCILIGSEAYLSRKHIPSQIIFYYHRQAPLVYLIHDKARSWTWTTSCQSSDLTHNFWKQKGMAPPQAIQATYSHPLLKCHENIISFHGKHIAIVCDKRWEKRKAKTPFRIDYLYICKGYKGTPEHLAELFNAPNVVLCASLPSWQNRQLQEYFTLHHRQVYDIAKQGALVLSTP